MVSGASVVNGRQWSMVNARQLATAGLADDSRICSPKSPFDNSVFRVGNPFGFGTSRVAEVVPFERLCPVVSY
jgi:hypothetical protein